MKFNFSGTPEQISLIKAMAHRDRNIAYEAQAAFTTIMEPLISEQFLTADTTTRFYKDMIFDQDDNPTLAVDLYADVPKDHFTIWSQNMPGGLPSNLLIQGPREVKFNMYNFTSAVSYLISYLQKGRVNDVAKGIERLLQEVLLKVQQQGWITLLGALAGARHAALDAVQRPHVFASKNAGQLTLDDFNGLLVLFRRLQASWSGGTPVGGVSRPSAMAMSPELLSQMRAMAYNPINTKAPLGITATAASAAVTLPEADRKAIYNNAGYPTFFDIELIELLELGKNRIYAQLFQDVFGTANTIQKIDLSGTATAFDASSQELAIVLDASRDFAFRALQKNEGNQVFTLQPDDQFVQRSKKVGFYGSIEEGRLVTETRTLCGLVI